MTAETGECSTSTTSSCCGKGTAGVSGRLRHGAVRTRPNSSAKPRTEPEQIYAILTAAGHKLTWDETVSARMPLPDERATLQIPDATPIVHATRVTLGTDQRPLILEDLRAGADRTQLAYRITPDSPRALRAV
ncbi:hypothetical protein Scani_12290 [Streptomyces caniferus]|uniref:UbiC transcription regulator-associated domain-containing protein n=1 Tax=Streptomyces caniferus TaxID=285557 RepID=A0A640S3I3_9ACTN|nr:hypothetical protein Scani_12290 [Streptomyces caniferus]